MLLRWGVIFAACAALLHSQIIVIRPAPAHLRSGEQREWRSFPAAAGGRTLSVEFEARENSSEHSLILRQLDVKAVWTVSINGASLGQLIQDERSMTRMLPVPARTLRNGTNRLEIACKPANFSDDIRVSDIRLEPSSVATLQRQSTIDIKVTSAAGALPVRLTVVDKAGSLVPFASLRSGAKEAIRTGVLYTADGRASLGLPAGDYRIYASRGFEYSAPSRTLRLTQGQRSTATLRIEREVEIPGYISVDTHVHTLELSGHGDASVKERALTAAGEGLDAIAATEHNQFSDYTPTFEELELSRWVATIPGTEITTATGHFNVFPTRESAPYPNPKETDWQKLMDAVTNTGSVRIQNHPRDIHSNYRPFDPQNHLSPIGENRIGRPFRANALEIVNSGAMASDPLQLARDWMGLLTRGETVAGIGASDTHTVDFVPIGQARTYIDVSGIAGWRGNAGAVANRVAAGRTLVSYGLAVDLNPLRTPTNGKAPVEVTVWGPSWSRADQLTIYSNGLPVWQQPLPPNTKGGRKFKTTVHVPIPAHDTALAAVVTGPGTLEPFWEVRKPYQPTSDEWTPIIIGVSRAVWIDGDGNRSKESPLDYARRLVDQHIDDVAALAKALAAYDSTVTMHALHLLQTRGQDIRSSSIRELFLRAPAAVVSGYTTFAAASR